jgi:hypothetical protein
MDGRAKIGFAGLIEPSGQLRKGTSAGPDFKVLLLRVSARWP